MADYETVILSLGGSLIVPNGGIDTVFLKEFNSFIRSQIADTNRRFFIVCGGGGTARHYMRAGKDIIGEITQEDTDWLGIHATRLNAQLLRTTFEDIAHHVVVDNYKKEFKIRNERVIVGAGWMPGCSTDYDAVLASERMDAKKLVNMSNTSYVYDKDPNKHADAKPIKKCDWKKYRGLIDDKWISGMNVPFGPVAAKRSEKLGLTVVIINGKDLENVKNALDGKEFVGTTIQ